MNRALIKWGLALLAVVILWWIIATWWASIWAWWPWSDKNRLENAENRADVAEAVVEGQGEIAASVEHHTIIIREAAAVQAQAEVQARTAPDANEPLPADRAARLHDADRSVCAVAATGACPKPDPAD